MYLYVKPKLDEVRCLQDKFYNSVEARKLRDIIYDMMTAIDECTIKARKIILEAKLRGKCKYL
jgi:hypothetical protein